MAAPIICLYGQAKTGKTSAAIAAFPNAHLIGVEANLDFIWRRTLGLPSEPAGVMWMTKPPPEDLETLVGMVEEARGWPEEHRRRGLIVDDAGKLIDRTYQKFDAQPESFSRKTGNKDAFYAGKKTAPIINDLCAAARYADIPVVLVMHEKEPKYSQDGVWQIGVPDLPWRSLSEDLEAWFDLNLRVVGDPDSLDPWFGDGRVGRRLFHQYGDKNWMTGDRSEVCWDATPGSLYEVLRAGGSPVTRFKNKTARIDLSWQDEVADEVAVLLEGVTDRNDVKRRLASKFKGRYTDKHEKHTRWAMQDGIARYQISKRLSRGLFDDIEVETEEHGGSGGVNLPPAK